ncbi:protein prenylyltransferase [Ascodesmis nigricans]|uniref:Geranylgeranyl transferase type-2 subunit alpha n=1 Tax=Ascodesmis nigricans TaxID=341454 RepID=A0A4S2N546_9PEZI|nr:protein prenylyltransferase [Ascodesmis nigricans]
MASHGVTRSSYAAQSKDVAARERELKKLTEYHELTAEFQRKRTEKEYTKEALDVTAKVLKINPEFYTVWNYRREILLHTTLLPFSPSPDGVDETAAYGGYEASTAGLLKQELAFLFPLLSSYPKCYWIWNHRLWALHQATRLLSPPFAEKFWRAELDLVGLMLSRDMRNFHGWMYRRFVVANIEQPEKSLVEEEFAYTSGMVRGVGGMTNYSAWHQRSVLIPRLLEERGSGEQERMDFLEDELELLKRAMSTDPDDQSLWFYHRWLVYANALPGDRTAIAPDMPVVTRILLLVDQIEWLKELLESHSSCKYILKALVSYVGLYRTLKQEPIPDEDREDLDEVDENQEQALLKEWLDTLVRLDPMRRGRYMALRKSVLIQE